MVALNAVSKVREVWVSLTRVFSCDVLACGDVGCLYLQSRLAGVTL